MPRATWNGAVIAESDEVQVVDGYTYFPPAGLATDHVRESTHTSVCGWKGLASYYDVVVGGEINANAAWVYRDPKPAANHISGWVAFWKGVRIEG